MPVSKCYTAKFLVWGRLKMKYETPYIEIIRFEDADIVTASGLTVESAGDGDWKDFGDLFG